MDTFLIIHQKKILAGLLVLATVKTFLMCGAYPPLTNIDEPHHLDLIAKYARCDIPGPNEYLGLDVAEFAYRYGSREYGAKPGMQSNKEWQDLLRRHPWQEYSQTSIRDFFVKNPEALALSSEVHQPPAYYILAALLYRVSRQLHFQPLNLFYAVRFMNVLFVVLTIYVSFKLIERFIPQNISLMLGVPMMIAMFPQDTFFQLGNDVLSPLITTLALFSLFLFISEHPIGLSKYVLAGLLAAFAVLTKLSNLPVLGMLVLVCVIRIIKVRKKGSLLFQGVCIAALVLCAAFPLVLWGFHNYSVFGDVTGGTERMRQLSWTFVPMTKQLEHPLFSVQGLDFLSHKTGLSHLLYGVSYTFWRGEITWYNKPIRSLGSDFFYYATSLMFPLVSACHAFKKKTPHRSYILLSFLFLVTMVAQLAVLSIIFDFGSSPYPSSERPYMMSGRLIIGALVPFLLLYVDGLLHLLKPVRERIHPLIILLVIMVIVNVIDLSISFPALKASGTWFSQ